MSDPRVNNLCVKMSTLWREHEEFLASLQTVNKFFFEKELMLCADLEETAIEIAETAYAVPVMTSYSSNSGNAFAPSF